MSPFRAGTVCPSISFLSRPATADACLRARLVSPADVSCPRRKPTGRRRVILIPPCRVSRQKVARPPRAGKPNPAPRETDCRDYSGLRRRPDAEPQNPSDIHWTVGSMFTGLDITGLDYSLARYYWTRLFTGSILLDGPLDITGRSARHHWTVRSTSLDGSLDITGRSVRYH